MTGTGERVPHRQGPRSTKAHDVRFGLKKNKASDDSFLLRRPKGRGFAARQARRVEPDYHKKEKGEALFSSASPWQRTSRDSFEPRESLERELSAQAQR